MPHSSSPSRDAKRVSAPARWALSTVALALFALVAFAAAVSCGGGSSPSDPGANCPSDLPSCPQQVPSYAVDIKPIVEQHCFPCHAPGGIGVGTDGRDFSRYDALHARQSAVLNQVYGCTMPPADGGVAAPVGEQRAAFLTWLVCQSPNN